MSENQGKSKLGKVFSKREKESPFEAIYKKYFDKLYLYARAICDTEPMAKDVVSDLFYSLLNNDTDFSEIDNLDTYLFVSVRNRSIKALSRKKHSSLSDDNLEVKLKTIDHVNPEELLLEKELMLALEKIVEALPNQCQLIFRMAKEQHMKYAEIALELEISVETVKSQLKIGQRKLRAEIVKFYLDSDQSNTPDLKRFGYSLLVFGLDYCDLHNLIADF